MCSFIANKGYFCQYMWMTSKMAGKKQTMAPMWKKLMKNVDIDEPTSFLDHENLGCTQCECKPNETIIEENTKMFESRVSAGAAEKLSGWQTSRTNSSVVLRHGGTFSKMRWAILRIGKQESGAIVQSLNSLPGWPSIQAGRTWISWRIVRNLLTKCLIACTWNELDDLISCGQSTSLRDQSQNGLRHVAEAWQGWFLTLFITRTISDNIVMWVIRHSIADWVCFQTQTLLEILRTQHQPQELSCVFLEAEHLSQSVGCTRSKLLSRAVPQNVKSFLWMLDYVWVTSSRSLGHSDRSVTFNKQQGPSHTSKPAGNWESSWFQNQETTCQKKTKGWSVEWSGLCTHQHTFFSRWFSVVHF